jgi:hypothetical protein
MNTGNFFKNMFSLTFFIHFIFLAHIAGALYSAYIKNYGDMWWGVFVSVWAYGVVQGVPYFPT